MRSKEKASTMSLDSLSNSQCPKCGGLGMIVVYRSTNLSRRVYGDDRLLCFAESCPNCHSKDIANLKEAKERSNIPPAFYDSKFADFNWEAYKDKEGNTIDLSGQKRFVESFISEYKKWKDKGMGFYIYSRMRGSGKTFLASAICNDLMQQYQLRPKFVSEAAIIDLADQDNKFKSSNIDNLCKCELLCIDDLGAKTTGNDWMNDLLFKIIDYRYQHSLVTIVTSNIRPEKLELDNRIVSRLASTTQNLPLPEFSFRQTESNEQKREFFKEMGLLNGNN